MVPHGKKVIAIVTSPRRGMNTATLVQKVLEGAQSRGLMTEFYQLCDYTVNPCDACDACMESGVCAQADDMSVFHSAFERARVLIVGTPIYFDHVSAQLKALLDRLYLYTGPNPDMRFPSGVKAVIVATWEEKGAETYDDVIKWLAGRFSHYFDIETVGVIKAPGTSDVPVHQRADLLQEAFAAGAALAAYFD